MKNTRVDSNIILASKSPRRKYLLSQAGLKFSVMPSAFDESSIPVVKPETYVQILAENKAADIASRYPEKWVIGADTIVVIDDMILGKPKSKDQARDMLKKLSGATHQVYTGYAIICESSGKKHAATVQTDVIFKTLSDREIEWYINTDEPFDKAGAYAIQGLGTFLVKRINGSYTNVVGLPVCEILETLIMEEVIGFTIGENGYHHATR
ncbi:MAG: septum formation inhibitor Maf [Proteobacteria bacterium]|nr:septum formation inhibitor Maf [Pseudomonadota bacterium]